MTSRTVFRVGLAALLLPFLGGGGRAWAEQAKSTIIDLKIAEQKNPSSWYGFQPGPDGKTQHPFACTSGKLTLQAIGDKLRADSNGDGVIDDKDAPAVELKDNVADPARVTVTVKLVGKTIDYPIAVRSQKSGENRFLIVGSGACLEGKLGQSTVRIFDGNLDGKFTGQGDRIAVETPGRQDPYAMYGMPFSRVVTIDRKLQEIELLGEGAQLKLTPYTGPVAEVQIETEKTVANLNVYLTGADGGQLGLCSTKETTLFVPGKYRIWTISYQPAVQANRPAFMSGSQDQDKPPFELKAGKNALKFGPPFKMDFAATYSQGTLDLTAVKIAGASGELYRPSLFKEQGDSFASYVKAGGKEMKLADLEFS